MRLLLDIFQGMGAAAAAGLRPFLPTLLVGGLAAGDLGVDFEGTDVAFLEEPWFLAVMAAALVASILLRGYFENPPAEAALQGIGIGLGALLFAGTLDDRHDTWWPGLIAGAACAFLAGAVARDLFGRVRNRFRSKGDDAAAGALPIYAESAAVFAAGLSVLAPPVGLIVVGFLLALALKGRRRDGQKYAGLRSLR